MDGYHLLQTMFRFIDLNDTLRFTVREDGEVHRINVIDGVPSTQDLCVRTALLLQKETACKLGVDIELDKHIPMGGGLGGGSSDAATTLLALNRLWNLNLSRDRLMEIGLSLGADVPIFVFGENAFAEGIGERLQAFPLPDAWYVVLIPPVHVPTSRIFSHPQLTRNTISFTIRALPIGGDFNTGQFANDLQSTACTLYPEIEQHLNWLAQFAPAMMTGSGACVFAEFTTEEAAKAVLQQLPKTMHGLVAHGLQQHPLQDFAE